MKQIQSKAMALAFSFERNIETASVISVHCPLLPETKGLIGRKELKKMRKDCLLINSSRGGIVNEADLVEAIKEKSAGAIDVFLANPLLSHPYHSILIILFSCTTKSNKSPFLLVFAF